MASERPKQASRLLAEAYSAKKEDRSHYKRDQTSSEVIATPRRMKPALPLPVLLIGSLDA